MLMIIIIMIIIIITIIIVTIITIIITIIITKKIISFIRRVFRAWPNIREEPKYINTSSCRSFLNLISYIRVYLFLNSVQ